MAKTQVVEVDERNYINIDPTEILTDQNIRFKLRKARVEMLKDKIIEAGRILQPISVSALTDEEAEENPGKAYRAEFGHYRIAALTEARKEGHDILMPAELVEAKDPVDRIKTQISENLDRENMSPIDRAVAMKAALDTGLSKAEVRNLFATPGGRKGLKVQALSNSSLNMTLSFLEFSPKIQNMIHEGEIGVADAYWLSKQPVDKQEAAVEKAISNRLRELETEEEDENKYLESEKKRTEADAKSQEAEKQLEAARVEYDKGIEELKERAERTSELFLKKAQATTPDEKKILEDEFKVAEKSSQEAEKLLAAKRKEFQKLEEKAKKQLADAEERANKLKAARETAQATSKKAGTAATKPLQVAKSAAVDQKNHPNTQGIRLALPAITKVIDTLSLASECPKVTAIGKAFKDLIHGRVTDKQLFTALAEITGELKEVPVTKPVTKTATKATTKAAKG